MASRDSCSAESNKNNDSALTPIIPCTTVNTCMMKTGGVPNHSRADLIAKALDIVFQHWLVDDDVTSYVHTKAFTKQNAAMRTELDEMHPQTYDVTVVRAKVQNMSTDPREYYEQLKPTEVYHLYYIVSLSL